MGLRRLRLYFGDEEFIWVILEEIRQIPECQLYSGESQFLFRSLEHRYGKLSSAVSALIIFMYPLEFLCCLLHLSHLGQTHVVVNQEQLYCFL